MVKCKYCDFATPAALLKNPDEFECEFCATMDTKTILETARKNLEQDFAWFEPDDGPPCIIVGGAPSLRYTYPKVAEMQAAGGVVFATNNTLKFLAEREIIPDYYVLMDRKPENVNFIADAPANVKYLIGSTVHPSVTELLKAKGREVYLWHPTMEKVQQEMTEVLRDFVPQGVHSMSIGGGSTVCLRAIFLAVLLRYRDFHLFGMDSSLTGQEHHAYDQPWNDGVDVMEIKIGGRPYITSGWMMRQVLELTQFFWDHLFSIGCRFEVYGDGMLQDIVKIRKQGPINFKG